MSEEKVRQKSSPPVAQQGPALGSSQQPSQKAPDSATAMGNLVSLALSCAGEGRSGLEFERDVVRFQLAGAFMGRSLHSRHFFRETVFCADKILSFMESISFNQPLPGTGIASDFALLLDPVALGTTPIPKNLGYFLLLFLWEGTLQSALTPEILNPWLS